MSAPRPEHDDFEAAGQVLLGLALFVAFLIVFVVWMVMT